ncbi:uncharacterized protein LOC119404287 [Rhipicephalus sanguineus]|uniref:uncharacterized protein LOC119404287 n=1 Tax=Rhipicephalus sanguineus TaxID=34632 RepID=UPI00189566E9|nr:uncharacterized protein LOC119404287 [Rhipicephalus sanguineus]
MTAKVVIALLLLALTAYCANGQGQGKGLGRGKGQGHGQGRGQGHGHGRGKGGPVAVGGPLTSGPLPGGGGGGQFRESGGFRQTEGHRVEEGFEQTDFFNRGQGNGAAFLGTNAGVLESGLLQQVKGKFKIMGKLRGYTAAGSSLQQQQG